MKKLELVSKGCPYCAKGLKPTTDKLGIKGHLIRNGDFFRYCETK